MCTLRIATDEILEFHTSVVVGEQLCAHSAVEVCRLHLAVVLRLATVDIFFESVLRRRVFLFLKKVFGTAEFGPLGVQRL